MNHLYRPCSILIQNALGCQARPVLRSSPFDTSFTSPNQSPYRPSSAPCFSRGGLYPASYPGLPDNRFAKIARWRSGLLHLTLRSPLPRSMRWWSCLGASGLQVGCKWAARVVSPSPWSASSRRPLPPCLATPGLSLAMHRAAQRTHSPPIRPLRPYRARYPHVPIMRPRACASPASSSPTPGQRKGATGRSPWRRGGGGAVYAMP